MAIAYNDGHIVLWNVLEEPNKARVLETGIDKLIWCSWSSHLDNQLVYVQPRGLQDSKDPCASLNNPFVELGGVDVSLLNLDHADAEGETLTSLWNFNNINPIATNLVSVAICMYDATKRGN